MDYNPTTQARDFCERMERLVSEIETLRARLRPGVSEMLNELIDAGMAHVNPVSGEISFTPQGKLLVERTRDFEHRSGSNN